MSDHEELVGARLEDHAAARRQHAVAALPPVPPDWFWPGQALAISSALV
jgi:hypothetical protein